MRYLARRNIAGHRKRFLLTVLSLFLGLETFLWADVVTSGSDYAYVIGQRPGLPDRRAVQCLGARKRIRRRI